MIIDDVPSTREGNVFTGVFHSVGWGGADVGSEGQVVHGLGGSCAPWSKRHWVGGGSHGSSPRWTPPPPARIGTGTVVGVAS